MKKLKKVKEILKDHHKKIAFLTIETIWNSNCHTFDNCALPYYWNNLFVVAVEYSFIDGFAKFYVVNKEFV